MASHVLYSCESKVRAVSILDFGGAGGTGFALSERSTINSRDDVAFLILPIHPIARVTDSARGAEGFCQKHDRP